MLHIRIADSLYEQKIIEYKDNKQPDTWLALNGWVKINKDWILFDGYLMKEYNLGYFKLTNKQLRELIKYGNECYSGILKCGTSRRSISTNELEISNQEQLCKIFN